jgi:hypothetical protein
VDCAIIDPQVNNWPLSAEEEARLEPELRRLGFQSVYQCGSLQVWQSSPDPARCLTCRPDCASDEPPQTR